MVTSGDIAVQLQVVRVVFQGFFRRLDGIGVVVVYHVEDDHVAPPVGIGRIHVQAVAQLLDGALVVLAGIQVLTVELVDFCLVRMLLDEDGEQLVDSLGGVLLREPLADVAQQHAQLGVHVELLGSERIVNLLLIACAVARLVAVLGAREVNQSIVGGIFLGTVQIVQGAVGHAVVLEQAAHGEVVGIVLRCGRQHAAHFL